jgi:2-C-methyl-D-erythritol 4-phosphate cytidylyltransferase
LGYEKVGAVIAAAGESRRMGGRDKIFAPLGGKPILARVIDAFQKCRPITQIVVVVSEKNLKRCRKLAAEGRWDKVSDVCAGGKLRQDSVAAGLKRLNCEWVVIHDGARPLVTKNLIERGLKAAQETGAAVAAIPVTDTIKFADDDRIVHQTPPRQNLWAVQTPQVFRIDIIARAYKRAKGEVTDDASLVEKLGYKVKLYMGSYDKIKITNADDLALAGVLLKRHGK